MGSRRCTRRSTLVGSSFAPLLSSCGQFVVSPTPAPEAEPATVQF
jgi:hypothetical protein